MSLNIPDRVPIENFVIEDNIVKGVQQDLPESYQIGNLLFDMFDRKPDHVIQIQAETGEQTTFLEMKENSIRCAIWLKKQGIRTGDIVTICAGNFLNAYIPILASFYTGATYNAWNNRLSLRETQHLMRTIQPKIIFVSEDSAAVIVATAKAENYGGKIIAYDSYPGLESLKDLMQQQSDEEVKSFRPLILDNPEDTCYIIMSSGTTGLPKGVVHSYRNFVQQIVSLLPYSIKGVILWYSPFFWVTGFVYFMQTIFNCGTRIIHSQFDPEATCRVIEKYKVEHILTSPTSLGHICKSNVLNNYPLKSLKLVMAGGSKTSKNILENLKKMLPHVIICQALGTSEVSRAVLCQTEKCKAIDSIGFVTACCELKIRDLKTNECLESNKPGELCIKSSMNMKGYYNNKSATKEAIDDEGWFHTGDIAYYDENGEFFVVDRLKEIMKYQNYQVSPSEIEEVLLTHPDVIEVSVVAIPHEIDGDHAIAFVKKSPDSQVTEEELVKLSETLGEVKKLHGGVKFVDEVPKTPAGKIARQVLKEWAKALSLTKSKNDIRT